MIYPIRAYGDPVLRKECEEVSSDNEKLKDIISNMFETMDASRGVGLAAPQVGINLRMFMIDSTHFEKDDLDFKGRRQVFINPEIIEETGEEWAFEEGCLSIPDVREDVSRNAQVKLSYQDENFKDKTEIFDGMTARVIQHEYDHIEGVLFIDHISAFKRKLIKGKLNQIAKGKIKVGYRMKFYSKK